MSTTTTKRRHGARVHGTQVQTRAKRAPVIGLYAAAEEFNRAFDRVFCATRPWLKRERGYLFDPFKKAKATTP
jgi:hypothetical protein